jgi:hypothetical protein
MRVDLITLQTERPIVHPTLVERVVICGDRMKMVVSGYPWWVAVETDVSSPFITLIFEKLSEGVLPVPFENQSSSEDLDGFSVQPLATIAWAQSARNEIFCHRRFRTRPEYTPWCRRSWPA